MVCWPTVVVIVYFILYSILVKWWTVYCYCTLIYCSIGILVNWYTVYYYIVVIVSWCTDSTWSVTVVWLLQLQIAGYDYIITAPAWHWLPGLALAAWHP